MKNYSGNPLDKNVVARDIGTGGGIPLKTDHGSSNPLVILMPEGGKHDIRTVSLHYKYSPEQVTVQKGSKVMWINQDPIESHGINLIDKISGKAVFSYPVIRFGTTAYYIFNQAGVFMYSDPILPSVTGQITVVN